MPARPRRSSARVTLVLLGAAALAACGQEDDTLRRDLYSSKEDCIKDWGDQFKCEEQPSTGHTSGYHPGLGYWYGPYYRPGQFGSSPRSEPPGTVGQARPGSHSVGTSHVSRGGFGASGAAHGSGGS
jgi:uncharacterized protein YgiB involved in biofilm formation